MAHPTAVINVVGLNQSLIGDWSPNLKQFVSTGNLQRLKPDMPAVTCTVQSSMLTGMKPSAHGVVGNGWYNREMCDIQFWKQSNNLVRGEKVWDTARKQDPSVTTLNMFWWFNMYSTADYSVAPRPIYKADGRKLPDCYSNPPELRDELQKEFGQFPLFNFWGPGSSIKSSEWIANATMHAHEKLNPTLTLVYLPHLDYCLQKLGPDHPDIHEHVGEIDAIIGEMLQYFTDKGVRVIIVSEYGIEPVEDAIPINRMLRKNGSLRIREEDGLELMDPGASDAFAVADHQIAHVYLRNPNEVGKYALLCRAMPGVDQVYRREDQARFGLNHERSGDLLLVANEKRWFCYNYWLEDRRAPDFARTVDIHSKPGYDPLELFIDPMITFPWLFVPMKLFRRKVLHQRTLLDVIPLDPKLVKGSHGRIRQPDPIQPVVITQRHHRDDRDQIACQEVRNLILQHLFENEGW